MNLYLIGVGQFYDRNDERLGSAESNDAPRYQRAVTVQSGIRIATGFRRSEAINATIVIENKSGQLNKLAAGMFVDAELRKDSNLLLKGSVERITVTATVIRIVIVE